VCRYLAEGRAEAAGDARPDAAAAYAWRMQRKVAKRLTGHPSGGQEDESKKNAWVEPLGQEQRGCRARQLVLLPLTRLLSVWVHGVLPIWLARMWICFAMRSFVMGLFCFWVGFFGARSRPRANLEAGK